MDMLRVDWRWVGILAGALIVAALLAVAAFVEDRRSAPVNLLTEVAGVVTGTALTVFLIDELRRRRERRDADSLRRSHLTRELAHNLSRLVTRRGSSAVVKHSIMSTLRAEQPLSADDVKSAAANVRLSKQDAQWLAMAIMPRLKIGDLRTEAIQAALADGAYLEIRRKKVFETPVHAALERIIRDVDRLKTLDRPSTFGIWDTGLLETIAVANHSGAPHCDVSAFWLVTAYSYYDMAEDIWQEQLALLRDLLGGCGGYEAPVRQPITPLGLDPEQGIRAEAVTLSDVPHLVSSDIRPFGSRIPEDLFGDSREERINWLMELTKDAMLSSGIDVDDEELLSHISSTLEGIVDGQFAPEDEGIERIQHPRRGD